MLPFGTGSEASEAVAFYHGMDTSCERQYNSPMLLLRILARACLVPRRAFSWNLSTVAVTDRERAALEAAGVADPAMQRYAVWRRSLLAVAGPLAMASLILALTKKLRQGFVGETPLGIAADIAWLVAVGTVPLMAAVGVILWKRPRATSRWLTVSWMLAFFAPFALSLIPVSAQYKIGADDETSTYEMLLLIWLVSLPSYVAMLPTIVSLIPGLVNGCLRAKTLLPAAALPGWLLVTAAPGFLLFWLVVLVTVNALAESPLLMAGVVLWAGAPLLYTFSASRLVAPATGPRAVARVTAVKRRVQVATYVGLGCLLTYSLTAKVFGVHLVGFHKSQAITVRIGDFQTDGDTTSKEAMEALAESKSIVYAFDTWVLQFFLDYLAKMLIATAVFTDLAVRATAAAWRHEQRLKAEGGEADRDRTLAATEAACRGLHPGERGA